jgi:Arc/MetJ-type ribon-helix-helix transcriptional regulator
MDRHEVTLPQAQSEHARAQTGPGRHASVSDYVADLIRRDQQREQLGTGLCTLLDEAVASGEPVEMTPGTLSDHLQHRIDQVVGASE